MAARQFAGQVLDRATRKTGFPALMDGLDAACLGDLTVHVLLEGGKGVIAPPRAALSEDDIKLLTGVKMRCARHVVFRRTGLIVMPLMRHLRSGPNSINPS